MGLWVVSGIYKGYIRAPFKGPYSGTTELPLDPGEVKQKFRAIVASAVQLGAEACEGV